MDRILLSGRAQRDPRRLGPAPELDRLPAGPERLSEGAADLDIKLPNRRAPWLRLRIGDRRVLYRPADNELPVARMIHRAELQQATRILD